MSNTQLPENIEEIKKFAEEIKLDVKYLLGEKWEGDLNLNGVTNIPRNVYFNVERDLLLPDLRYVPEGVWFYVGAYLCLSSVEKLSSKLNVIVGGSLVLSNLSHIPDDTVFSVGRDVDLTSAVSVGDNVNMLIGGSLFNYHKKEIFDSSNIVLCKGLKQLNLFSFCDFEYTVVENVVFLVLANDDNVILGKRIAADDTLYIVKDGYGRGSYGKTLSEANENLKYSICDDDVSRCKSFVIDSVLTYQEAIRCYRSITGACVSGVKRFVNSVDIPSNLTIGKIIELTAYKFGNETFKKYFDK